MEIVLSKVWDFLISRWTSKPASLVNWVIRRVLNCLTSILIYSTPCSSGSWNTLSQDLTPVNPGINQTPVEYVCTLLSRSQHCKVVVHQLATCLVLCSRNTRDHGFSLGCLLSSFEPCHMFTLHWSISQWCFPPLMLQWSDWFSEDWFVTEWWCHWMMITCSLFSLVPDQP